MTTTFAFAYPVLRASVGLGRVADSLWARWRHAMLQRETRRTLAEMDDHMLQDLGISRAQAYFEVDSARYRGPRD